MGRKHVVSLDMFHSSDTNVPDDMALDLVSRTIDTSQMDKASIHLKWAAGPTGEFHVLVKNNEKDDFYELNFGDVITITGTDGELQFVLAEMPFMALQLTYTAGTGSAVLEAFLTEKTTGA